MDKRKGVHTNFNSRLLTETNIYFVIVCRNLRYFNSRLRKETNRITLLYSLDCFPFQLMSPQGDEPVYWNEKQEIVLFQFTSPRGDELKMARVLIRVYHFNSRLREGTNTFFQVFFKRIFSITTHIPARRRT